ncbi:MAG: arsenate reductase ArsC, partial [Gemmatimonadales bacterium]|nr:arsenate reductase ArsC [Gemmatimonadales bacterium]
MLFLCTQNSARSQMAEALLQWKGRGRFVAASAGAVPADAVHPTALGVLAAHGYEWRGRPKGLADVGQERWDFVITLCDRARETCPNLPGQPVYAHWGLPDPAAVEGDEAARVQAFEQAFLYLGRRIDLMLALPLERLKRAAAQH